MRLFLNMIPPKQRRMLYIATAVLVLIAVVVGATGRASMLKAVLIVGLGAIVTIALLWVLIHFVVKGARRKRQHAFDASVAAREGIDDRKREWQSWIQELERNKIDRYDLPFYLLVGEPQSGKSVLLQNSDLRFLFGQSRLSGIGGTRGCDWWFTEEAVILDLAGRLFTHDGGAADEAEWEAFLDLLNGFRPLDPANGIMLVIPCDSLLSDSPEVSAQKANKIREALLTLTRKLEAKLPIYAILTKGDKVFGFAETVHRLSLEQRHQMFGWSRPADKLEQALAPHELREAWTGIVERSTALRDSMLSSVRIPEAQAEVDRMLGFPEELEGLFAPLQTYFERIFQDSDLVDQLYFRGVYLTSGLQSGAPIAKVCLDILDQPGDADARDLETLFVRQQAYFIKDLVRRRVFGEKGLVKPTSARVTKARKTGRLGYGVAAGIAVLSVVWGIYEIRSDFNDDGRGAYASAIAAGQQWVPDDSTDRQAARPSIEALLSSLATIEVALDQDVSVAQALHGSRKDSLRDVYNAIYDEVYRFELQNLAATELATRTRGYNPDDLNARPSGYGAFTKEVRGALALREGFDTSDEAAALIEAIGKPGELESARAAHERRESHGDFARSVRDTETATANATEALNALWDKTLDPADKVRIQGGVGFLLGWYGLERAATSIAVMDANFRVDSDPNLAMYDVCGSAHRIFEWMRAYRESGGVDLARVQAFRLGRTDLPGLRARLTAGSTAADGSWPAYDNFVKWLGDQATLGLGEIGAAAVIGSMGDDQLQPATDFLLHAELINAVDPDWLGPGCATDLEKFVSDLSHAPEILAAPATDDLVASIVRGKLALAESAFRAQYPTWSALHAARVGPAPADAGTDALSRSVATQTFLVTLHGATSSGAVSLDLLGTRTATMLTEGIGEIEKLLDSSALQPGALRALVATHREVVDDAARRAVTEAIEDHLGDYRDQLGVEWDALHAKWGDGLGESPPAAPVLARQTLDHLAEIDRVFGEESSTFDPGRDVWLASVDGRLERLLAEYVAKIDGALKAQADLGNRTLAEAAEYVSDDLIGFSRHDLLKAWHSTLAGELKVPAHDDDALADYAAKRGPERQNVGRTVLLFQKISRPGAVGGGASAHEKVRTRIERFAAIGKRNRGRGIAELLFTEPLVIAEIKDKDSTEITAYRTFARYLNESFEDVVRRELRTEYIAGLEKIVERKRTAFLSFWPDGDSGKQATADSMKWLFGRGGTYRKLLDNYKQLEDAAPIFRRDPFGEPDDGSLSAGTQNDDWWILDAFLEDMLLYAHNVPDLLALKDANPDLGPLDGISISFRPRSDNQEQHEVTWDRFVAFRSPQFTGTDFRSINSPGATGGIFTTEPCPTWGLEFDYQLELIWRAKTTPGSREIKHSEASCLAPFLLFWRDTKTAAGSGKEGQVTRASIDFLVEKDSEGKPSRVKFDLEITPAPPRRPAFDQVPSELNS